MLLNPLLPTTPFPPAAAGAARAIDASALPATQGAKGRNTALDWLFYDIGNLTPAEFSLLVRERNQEGAILVIWPSGAKGEMAVRKFADHEELCAAPGKLLARFAVAGVGSSDVGAAAFARTLADRYQEPVGAVVAGYGVADLLAEALGGWLVLGAANFWMKAYHDALNDVRTLTRSLEASDEDLERPQARQAAQTVVGHSDSVTLLKLLLDEARKIKSVAGHSKGSLSIAYALEGLVLTGQRRAIKKAKATRVTTAGAVVALPEGFDNAGQYLGATDWFGGMNSRLGVDHQVVPLAWHHLNTSIPLHMDFAAVLQGEPD